MAGLLYIKRVIDILKRYFTGKRLKMTEKFIFYNGIFKNSPYCHANYIRQKNIIYDTVIRGIILEDIKTIYLRINDLTFYNGLEFKKIDYQFNKNLTDCKNYLKENFTDFKIYDSYSINLLPKEVERYVLSV